MRLSNAPRRTPLTPSPLHPLSPSPVHPLPFAAPVRARHNDTAQAAYVDGHAKAVHCTLGAANAWHAINGATFDSWVVGGGPYNGRTDLQGLVDENGNLVP